MKNLVKLAVVSAPLAFVAGMAQAHSGVGPVNGFAAGAIHPLTGADHLLAMVGVGLWASMLGGRAKWLVPAAFLAAMAAGGALAMLAVGLPLVELMIMASVVTLGGLVAAGVRVPTAVGMMAVALFALFHGHAHGTEIPVAASGFAYVAGFTLATAALHALGLAIGHLAGRASHGLAMRATGGAIALAGVALMVSL